MRYATFTLMHKESNSRALIECRRDRGKIKITDIAFIRGNVIVLDAVRKAISHADRVIEG